MHLKSLRIEEADGTSLQNPGRDRRESERRVAVQSTKLFLRSSGRYAPGITSNVSRSGALLRVDRSQALRVGDEVGVAIDWGTAGVVSHDDMRSARVVRVVPMDCHHQAVAICYDRALEAALAA